MLRFIAAILFGGGALGAFAGWALVQYLEARRKRIVTVVRAVADDTRRGLVGGLREASKPPKVEPVQLPPPPLNHQQSFRQAQEAAEADPQIGQWLARQREMKLQMMMEQHLLWEEEERRKHEPGSPE